MFYVSRKEAGVMGANGKLLIKGQLKEQFELQAQVQLGKWFAVWGGLSPA